MTDHSFIRLEADVLHVGNALFEQRWQLGSGAPKLSFFALSGKHPWVDDSAAVAPAGTPAAAVDVADVAGNVIGCEVQKGRYHAGEKVSVTALVALRQAGGGERSYHFQVFDSVAGCILRQVGAGQELAASVGADSGAGLSGGAGAAGSVSAAGAQSDGGIETDPPASVATQIAVAGADAVAAGVLPPFVTSRGHLEVTEVSFAEQSDHHSEFVFERSLQMHHSESAVQVQSNLLLLGDFATGDGLGLLLLAPSMLVRGQWGSQAGYVVESARCPAAQRGCLSRISATFEHYPLVLLAWEGGRSGATAALHSLQHALHEWRQGRDGLFLSNTWGDRGRGDRISEAFVLEEVALAKRLGTDVVEIDDGWQSGQTANTKSGQAGVWNGFWASSQTFWEPSQAAFPRGIGPVVQAAKDGGMQFGLWFAPDSSNDFANWQKDADVLLGFWRQYGVTFFKLDAIKIGTQQGERNLYRMLERVQEGSAGAILLDMDLTAERRLTYWGTVSGSTLFLQNRYTDWGNYYPHQTLRALWSLSAYVLPSRLRLEVLNPERNAQMYGSDPLRPAAYAPEYLLAITLPASGLGWFEHTGLSERVIGAWASLLSVWKTHREAWHGGRVQRIGQAPSGFGWTGFISAGKDALYVLVFRELNEHAEHRFCLSHVLASAGCGTATGAAKATTLAGQGSAELVQGSVLQVTIPQPQHFLLAKIELS